jgi:hypothetical protein
MGWLAGYAARRHVTTTWHAAQSIDDDPGTPSLTDLVTLLGVLNTLG